MMARRKTRARNTGRAVSAPSQSAAPPTTASRGERPPGAKSGEGGFRETVESIVIAFALAFLFRTFEAEAFVIPTGSMAPTLMGRHKDVTCDVCGYSFQVSASEEVDARSGRRLPRDVISATCPMCRHTITGLSEKRRDEPTYSYNGDRIIAAKFAGRAIHPNRWDVVVFRFPEEAQTNYIKRLIGLPGEVVRIFRGDIYTRPLDGEGAFQIERKPPQKVLATLQLVHDNDYLPAAVLEAGYPRRWRPLSGSEEKDETSGMMGWKLIDDGSGFAIDAGSEGTEWLVYEHTVPPPWLGKEELRRAAQRQLPRPQLITDFSAYNTERTSGFSPEPPPESLGLHWVGDLAMELELNVRRATGQLTLRLIEGGTALDCRVNLENGKAVLACDALEDYHPQAETPLHAPGKYHLRFANVDDQLLLWVDDQLVEFDAPTAYGPLPSRNPQPADLRPLRIGCRQATVEVNHLRVWRDLYYITARGILSHYDMQMISDFVREDDPETFAHVTARSVAQFMSTPAKWRVFSRLKPRDFRIEADQFFFLGDNSARSKDSRLWATGRHATDIPAHVVERDLLIGKAIYVYWPHALPAPYHVTLSVLGRQIPFPFYPNFHRMGFIR